MRLRDKLRHPNFTASAMAMTDDELMLTAECAAGLQRDHQMGLDIGEDWRDHVLALMLLRDCIGREMVRRLAEPVGPPMLARGWQSEDIYSNLSSAPCCVILPAWLLEWGRSEQMERPE